MKKFLEFIGVALLALGIGAVAVPGPALADTACPSTSGYICWYDNSNFTGFLALASVSGHLKSVCYQLSTASRNKASSIINNSDSDWIVYDGGSCETTPGVIYAHSSGAMDSEFNNDITSYYRSN